MTGYHFGKEFILVLAIHEKAGIVVVLILLVVGCRLDLLARHLLLSFAQLKYIVLYEGTQILHLGVIAPPDPLRLDLGCPAKYGAFQLVTVVDLWATTPRVVVEIVAVWLLELRTEVSVNHGEILAIHSEIHDSEHLVLLAHLLLLAAAWVHLLVVLLDQQTAVASHSMHQLLALFGQSCRFPVVFPTVLQVMAGWFNQSEIRLCCKEP